MPSTLGAPSNRNPYGQFASRQGDFEGIWGDRASIPEKHNVIDYSLSYDAIIGVLGWPCHCSFMPSLIYPPFGHAYLPTCHFPELIPRKLANTDTNTAPLPVHFDFLCQN